MQCLTGSDREVGGSVLPYCPARLGSIPAAVKKTGFTTVTVPSQGDVKPAGGISPLQYLST